MIHSARAALPSAAEGRRVLLPLAIIALAAAVRMGLIAGGWPELNSDEATLGLMALHIVHRGEHPIFEYGQAYMGVTESYLAALFFGFMGPTTFALRLGNVFLYSLFLVPLYLLASRLYSRTVGLVSLLILSLGPEELLFRQVESIGGLQETLFFGAVALWIAVWLATSPQRTYAPRRAAWAVLGLVAGLALWSDPLFLPFAATFALLLARYCGGEIAMGAWRWLTVGALIGLAPLLVCNVTTPLDRGTLPGLVARYIDAGTSDHSAHASLAQSVAGTLAVSMPMVTGARAVCALPPQEAWPLTSIRGSHVVLCSAVHVGWSVAFIVLWVLAVLRAALARRRLQAGACPDDGPARHSADAARTFARLMLLGGAGLTFLVYAFSSAPALDPRDTARYLSFLWLAVPAIVAELKPAAHGRLSLRTGVIAARKIGPLAFLVAALTLGTIDAYHALAWTQWRNQQEQAFVDTLVRVGATRIYSDYWTCNRVVFESRERISCATLLPDLRPGWDRYVAYGSIVRHDANASYVFRLGSPQIHRIGPRLSHTRRRYHTFALYGYVFFQPARVA